MQSPAAMGEAPLASADEALQTAAPSSAAVPADTCRNGELARQDIINMVQAEVKAQGVNARLALVVAEQESDFGQNNNSEAGARGPMQLMPETARQYHVEHICDAQQNIRAGVAFLKDLGREFDGNIMLIAAAYNAGQRRVYQARGIPANRETVNYVARITNAYYDYKNELQHSRLNEGDATKDEHIAERDPAGQPSRLNHEMPHSEDEWIEGTVLYVSNPTSN